MSEEGPPLPASTLVPALLRMVHGAGGFATVVRRGNAWGSALIILHRTADGVEAYEKLPALDALPVWRLAAAGEQAVEAYAAKQQRFDPDVWIIELDIADPARFVPGLQRRA
jgi:hypothetical protein